MQSTYLSLSVHLAVNEVLICMTEEKKVRIMFVCLGNICRSALAEAAFRDEVRRAGLSEHFVIESSGTGHWHVGARADQRMRETGRRFGLSLESHRAQQFNPRHFSAFDHVLVMDKNNLHAVLYLDRKEQHGHKVRLFREFDPEPDDFQVPDPYYGGEKGFENVFRIVQRTSRSLLEQLVEEYKTLRAANS